MKSKTKSKPFVQCDHCGRHQEDTSERGSSHDGHTMIVVSVYNPVGGFPEYKDKRRYYDFCSMKCLENFAKGQVGRPFALDKPEHS